MLRPALLFFTGLLLALASPLPADTVVEKTDLFTAGEGGHARYRIPGIVVTQKGTLLAYCEGRSNPKSDWGEIDVQLRRSTDGGRTWGEPRLIAHNGPRIEGNPKSPGGKDQTVNNPAAIAARDGNVHFLYCVNYARCFHMRSSDEGATWSAPVEITAAFEGFRPACDWKVIATGPGHGIQLRSGRLLMPVWLAYGKPGDHGPSVAATLYSDDQGATWKAGEIAAPNVDPFITPNESEAAELSDGTVLLNSRSRSSAAQRLLTTSPDGVTRWSAPRLEPNLWEPVCMGSLISLPALPGAVLFTCPRSRKLSTNPAPDGKPLPCPSAPRKNLSLQISRDNGKTWGDPQTIEEGPSAYSDLVALADGTVLCFYEREKLLTLARLPAAWLPARP